MRINAMYDMDPLSCANVRHSFGEAVRPKNEVIEISRKDAYSQILSALLKDRCEHNRFILVFEDYDGHEAEYQEIMERVRATLLAIRIYAPRHVS